MSALDMSHDKALHKSTDALLCTKQREICNERLNLPRILFHTKSHLDRCIARHAWWPWQIWSILECLEAPIDITTLLHRSGWNVAHNSERVVWSSTPDITVMGASCCRCAATNCKFDHNDSLSPPWTFGSPGYQPLHWSWTREFGMQEGTGGVLFNFAPNFSLIGERLKVI